MSDFDFKPLATDLFPERWPGSQKIVPFLGAGASASTPPPAIQEPTAFPDRAIVEHVLDQLHIPSSLETDLGDGDTVPKRNRRERLILQCVLALGYLMIEKSRRATPAGPGLLDQLIADDFPPSAGRLVEFFTSEHRVVPEEVSSLMRAWPKNWDDPDDKLLHEDWVQELRQTFRLLFEAARLWKANETLTTIAAYYEEQKGREQLFHHLHSIFRGKRVPTDTHTFIAKAARYHLELARAQLRQARDANEDASPLLKKSHYLIVTTNYDGLMEEAMKDLPWMMLYFKRPQKQARDPFVSVQLSPALNSTRQVLLDRHQGKVATKFVVDVNEPIVVLFKIHGSLGPESTETEDTVVITDFDYEDYIAGMGKDAQLVVPAGASGLMHNKSFLFLGYSLADWNIRTILTTLIRRRNEGKGGADYAVMKDVSTSAEAYCRRRKIQICPTTLDEFRDGVARHVRGQTVPLAATIP